MTTAERTKREIFLECDWSYDDGKYGNCTYTSIMGSLDQAVEEFKVVGKEEHSDVLKLLSNVVSLFLVPENIQTPFKPLIEVIDGQQIYSSFKLEQITKENLEFFESILDDIDLPLLKARLADILWVLSIPKNPEHASKAMDSYLEVEINNQWHSVGNAVYERAIKLALQRKDVSYQNTIIQTLLVALRREIQASTSDKGNVSLSIARLLDKHKLDRAYLKEIGELLFQKAKAYQDSGQFTICRPYYDLAVRKFTQCKDEQLKIQALVAKAKSFEQEADTLEHNIRANGLYGSALEAYRDIPKKYRTPLNLEGKTAEIQARIAESGKASLEEMHIFKTDSIDISDIVKDVKMSVGGKKEPFDALSHFINIHSGPDFNDLENRAKRHFDQSLFTTLFGNSHVSNDGRTIAKVPPLDRKLPYGDPANAPVLRAQMIRDFSHEVVFIVQSLIIPALRQINQDFSFINDLLLQICEASPIVPNGRSKLMADALSLGFEYEFGTAIHLICPQIENIVRKQLKDAGAQTSIIEDGIENEVGLSSLMERAEIEKIFGKNLAFEIECIFTEALGYNLRNNVAHGLLSDDEARLSYGSPYAWWMTLRIIMKSLMFNKINFD
ncbi:DUF4209 domain-containing protein [Acinetobacter calcoaceticus]